MDSDRLSAPLLPGSIETGDHATIAWSGGETTGTITFADDNTIILKTDQGETKRFLYDEDTTVTTLTPRKTYAFL